MIEQKVKSSYRVEYKKKVKRRSNEYWIYVIFRRANKRGYSVVQTNLILSNMKNWMEKNGYGKFHWRRNNNIKDPYNFEDYDDTFKIRVNDEKSAMMFKLFWTA